MASNRLVELGFVVILGVARVAYTNAEPTYSSVSGSGEGGGSGGGAVNGPVGVLVVALGQPRWGKTGHFRMQMLKAVAEEVVVGIMVDMVTVVDLVQAPVLCRRVVTYSGYTIAGGSGGGGGGGQAGGNNASSGHGTGGGCGSGSSTGVSTEL
ncbi:hypothetical protein ACP70R_032693 [Stipagrostis hirtigluma subsp. patula]